MLWLNCIFVSILAGLIIFAISVLVVQLANLLNGICKWFTRKLWITEKVLEVKRSVQKRQRSWRWRKRESESERFLAYHTCYIILLPDKIDLFRAKIFWQKNLPRKKRRKLEAAREMLEDDDDVKVCECSFSFSCIISYSACLIFG